MQVLAKGLSGSRRVSALGVLISPAAASLLAAKPLQSPHEMRPLLLRPWLSPRMLPRLIRQTAALWVELLLHQQTVLQHRILSR